MKQTQVYIVLDENGNVIHREVEDHRVEPHAGRRRVDEWVERHFRNAAEYHAHVELAPLVYVVGATMIERDR